MHFGLATADEIAKVLATRLRLQRLAQNLQQSELAARAGISRKTLTNFERSGKVSIDVFLKIVAALGLSESFTTLFELKQFTIRDMEIADRTQRRKRASRRDR